MTLQENKFFSEGADGQFCVFIFHKNMVLFIKNMVVIYVFLLEEAMYSYFCLCILIVSLCILIIVYVLSMYSYTRLP